MKKLLLLFFLAINAIAQPLPPVSTFSIVAIDPQNGDMGVAVASRYFSVGSVVPWGLAGVGAVATQANVNVGYGQQAIDLLRQGLTAQQVLQKLLEEDKFEGKDGRQVADEFGFTEVIHGKSVKSTAELAMVISSTSPLRMAW